MHIFRYVTPHFMPVGTYVLYSLSSLLRLSWSFVQYIDETGVICSAIIGVSALFATVALSIAFRELNKSGADLLRMNLRKDVTTARVLLHNGLAVYVTWEVLSMHEKLGFILTWVGLPVVDARSISLGVLGAWFILYCLLDMTVADKYSRFTISPYLVLIFCKTADVVTKWDGGRNAVICAVIDAVIVFGFIIKITAIIARGRNNPEPISEQLNPTNKTNKVVPRGTSRVSLVNVGSGVAYQLPSTPYRY